MSRYTGITIGPIIDTMMLTSSPAGLWGVSYLYSWCARRMIQQLVDDGVDPNRFISPYFELSGKVLSLPTNPMDCEEMWRRGVGMFHDRIIFCSEGIENSLELARTARMAAIASLSAYLSGKDQLDCPAGDIATWLAEYLRIYAIERETSSPLLDLGKDLGALELEPRFSSKADENLLLRLLEDGGHVGAHNARVKRFLLSDRDENIWILRDRNGAVRDLQDIAACGTPWSGWKCERYYAVLNSDGDSMGEVLRSLQSDDEIRNYSSKCLQFCAKAARLMQEYGGVPLYAGGDDLLALLPVSGMDGCTIFGLVERLRKCFNTTFEEERNRLGGRPTISFGISVQYYKSPLYEALDRSRNLLWDAKLGLKNACYLNLQKHSGQSALITDELMDMGTDAAGAGEAQGSLCAAIDDLLRKTGSLPDTSGGEDEAAKFLSGAGAAIERHKSLFHQALCQPAQSNDTIRNLYENLFDNADQRQFKGYMDGLRDLTCLLAQKAQGEANAWEARKEYEKALEAADARRTLGRLQSAIRLLGFMREKGDEEA